MKIYAILVCIDSGHMARRDKTNHLKQAMMHELLTGKARLVSTGASHG